jgi:HEAT repeat protein
VKHFCPRCWGEVPKGASSCRQCGYELSAYDQLNFEEKLQLATHHPVREHQMMAIHVLGQRGSRDALSRFAEILETSGDPYLCLEVLRALAGYRAADALPLIEDAMRHPSRLVRRLAAELRAGLAAREET